MTKSSYNFQKLGEIRNSVLITANFVPSRSGYVSDLRLPYDEARSTPGDTTFRFTFRVIFFDKNESILRGVCQSEHCRKLRPKTLGLSERVRKRDMEFPKMGGFWKLISSLPD